jgi:catalase
LAETRYPEVDSFLGEKIGPTEIADATELAENLKSEIRKVYVHGLARRDAHPKAHGCVVAKFTVRDDLPDELRAGIFQPGATHDAVIRFSNGSPNAAGDDHNGDTRGMATKVYGVDGKKFFEDPAAPNAQDFIQISSPYFFVNDARGYTDFFERVNSGKTRKLFKIPFILGLKGTVNAAKMLGQKINNPLDVTYFSATPYQLGSGETRKAVKYSAKPCETPNEGSPGEGPNFLRHAMQDRLNNTNACFDFRIQVRPSDSFLVEDVVTEWDQDKAPFVNVAKITVPEQTFNTAMQNSACEAMTYNPWHAIAEHKPLGTINRMRRVVYESISDLRHEMNETKPAIIRGTNE